MIDTLHVATNAIPDTLRIILNSADKQSVGSQYAPLIVALIVVAISSYIQWVNAFKQRKIELQRLDLEWFRNEEFPWLDKFQYLIEKYTTFITLNFKDNSLSIKDPKFSKIQNEFILVYNKILLHMDPSKEKQKKLIELLNKDIKLINIKDKSVQKELSSNHLDSVNAIYHEIVDELYSKNS